MSRDADTTLDSHGVAGRVVCVGNGSLSRLSVPALKLLHRVTHGVVICEPDHDFILFFPVWRGGREEIVGHVGDDRARKGVRPPPRGLFF